MYFAKNIMYICVSKNSKTHEGLCAIDFETANGKRTAYAA